MTDILKGVLISNGSFEPMRIMIGQPCYEFDGLVVASVDFNADSDEIDILGRHIVVRGTNDSGDQPICLKFPYHSVMCFVYEPELVEQSEEEAQPEATTSITTSSGGKIKVGDIWYKQEKMYIITKLVAKDSGFWLYGRPTDPNASSEEDVALMFYTSDALSLSPEQLQKPAIAVESNT